MNELLRGRRILVTGASSGIGEHVARAIVAEGGQVAMLARREDMLNALATELGGVAVPADLREVGDLATAVDTAASRLGGLDGVCNVAGVLRYGSVSDTLSDVWQEMFEINVIGLLEVTRAAIPHLKDAGQGDVVNISSMSGRRILSAEAAVYGATKAAVNHITEGLRRELAPAKVRVTAIAPGMVDTDLFDQDDPRGLRRREQAGEVGLKPNDVAASVIHVLAAPPRVVHVDLAMVSIDQ